MPHTSFQVAIAERPELLLYGLKVRTNMTKAAEDCPRLWEKDFVPKMHELSGTPMNQYPGDSYGLSFVVDLRTGTFDYWAAMPLGAGISEPKEFSKVTLPGGLYAGCRVKNLQELGDAYSYLYGRWIGSTPDYQLKMDAPSVEVYDTEFMVNGSLELYVPVMHKS